MGALRCSGLICLVGEMARGGGVGEALWRLDLSVRGMRGVALQLYQ